MLACLDRRRSIRCLCFPLEKKTFELHFRTTETACFSAMHVHFTHFVVRARLHTIPMREATSYSVNLFRGLFQVVNRIVTKSARFVSGILRVRSFVLTHVPS